MFRKKCPHCERKIDKKFSFCPYCGSQFSQRDNGEDYGMLGKDDFVQEIKNEIRLPMRLDRLMGGLMKQFDKDFKEMTKENGKASFAPKGLQIRIFTGKPRIERIAPPQSQFKETRERRIKLSEGEIERRKKLPRIKAASKVRRLGDRIIYEISAPGVNSKEQVIITRLEESVEVKAYSKEKCYYKTIPLQVDVLGWGVVDERVVVELQG